MSDILLTTVGQTFAIFHDGVQEFVETGCEAGMLYKMHGHSFRTLPDLGLQLASFGTVNDVHFGETVCGLIEGSDMGPVLSVAEGAQPYPEVMSEAVIGAMQAANLDVVLVKGDLTANGTFAEFDRFNEVYSAAFGDRLHFIRGNHESFYQPDLHPISQIHIKLPGVELAMIDTSKPRAPNGTVRPDDLAWLVEIARNATAPVMVFGHHHIWRPRAVRDENFFGIGPDASEALLALFARQPALVGYFAGHTHRNRVQWIGAKPFVEVASVKDFPGMWAHYQVFERGILQINRRVNTPAALDWSEKTRVMYNGAYFDYAFGELAERCFEVYKQ